MGKGFRIVMLIFGIISSLIFFFTFFTVRENTTEDEKEEKTSLLDALRSLAHNGPWKIFALNILFMWGGYFLQAGALVYYYTAVLGSAELSVTVATIMSIVPVGANLCVPFLSKMMQKRTLFELGSGLQLIGLLVIWAGGLNRIAIYIGAALSAIGYGLKNSIYFSMQADPVDYGIWKTGVDTSGSLSAVNGFLGKVAQAAAGGISGLLISWGGYIGGSQVQTANALAAIRLMYLYIPIVCIVISMIIMAFYNLDSVYPKIRADLEKGKKTSVAN